MEGFFKKTVKKGAILGTTLLTLGGVLKSSDANAQTSQDSLEIHNLGLEHVNKFHPDLGANPDIKKFDPWGIEVGYSVDDTWKIDTLDKKEWVEFQLKKYKEALKNLEGWKSMRDSINQKDTLTSGDLKTLEYIKYLNLEIDIPSKEGHIKLLEEAIKKGILPVGLYNNHDPGFQKPTIIPKRKPE